MDPFVEHAVVHDGIVSVTRHEEHLHLRTMHCQALDELATAHLWHDHVGHHQMNRAGESLTKQQRLPGVLGVYHLVAILLQDIAGQYANLFFVFDEQDGLRPAMHGRYRESFGNDLGRITRSRQIDLECRTSTKLAVEPDRSVALPHDAEHS